MTHNPQTGDATGNRRHRQSVSPVAMDEIQTLYAINQQLPSAEDISAIMRVLQSTVAADAASLLHIAIERMNHTISLQYALTGDSATIPAQKLDIPFNSIANQAQTIDFFEQSGNTDDSLSALVTRHGGQSHIVIPLIDQGRVSDFIVVVYKSARTFTPAIRQLFEFFARQANVVAQNQRLLRESQSGNAHFERQLKVLETLNLLANSIGVDTDEQGIMLVTMQTLVEATGADHAGTVLIDPDGKAASVTSEYPDQGAIGVNIDVANNPVIDLLRQDMSRPILIEDVEHDKLIAPTVLEALRGIGIKSIIIAPLTVGGELIGSVGLDMYTLDRKFSPEMIELVDALTSQLAIYIQDARARRSAAMRLEHSQMVEQVINRFRTLNLVDSLLLEAARGLQEMLDARRVAIRLGDTEVARADQEASQV
ncbi:MAG: GAF domain-containing protein [Anaerolineae bacterium]|nr:GAF domain-containing protein [Anaerolineae bacterium]